jgi:hypothetical protein
VAIGSNRGLPTTDTDIRFKSRFETSGEFYRDIPPLTPRSEATVYAVTGGNIAELAATAFVALLIVLLSVRTIGYRGEQCGGGESVSQHPLKDKAFSTFLCQNPTFELRPKTGVSPPIFSWNPSWLIQVLAQWGSLSVRSGARPADLSVRPRRGQQSHVSSRRTCGFASSTRAGSRQ